MRTIRELSGWALVLLLWLMAPIALGLSALWLAEDDIWIGLPLGGWLLASTWPGVRLIARRLREPLPEEIAEADGRRPVLLLHRFEHVATPALRRLSALSPAMWRDWRDSRWRSAIERGLGPAGPVVPFARPAPPPEMGPVRALSNAGWEAELDRRLKRARLAAIVFDGSAACLHEVARAFAILGRRRTILILPAKIDAALVRAWPALQAQIAGLPELDSTTVAFRFSRDGAPLVLTSTYGGAERRRALLRAPSLMLLPHEPTPAPKAPSLAVVLMALPSGAGLAGALALPLLLRWEHVHTPGDAKVILGLISVVLGVTLSVLARRAFRLVASNELPMVFVASLPWLTLGLIPWLDGDWSHRPHALREWLEITAQGAAYATPLLLATAAVLAGSALLRATPGRMLAHGAFGVAALLPLATLVLSLSDAQIHLGIAACVLAAGGAMIALATAGASGHAGRAHAPLPIGAAAAGTLAIAAWATVITSARWHEMAASVYDTGALLRLSEGAPRLALFDQVWVWFALAVPAVVVLVGALHQGRLSRVAIGNLAALAPMVVLLGLASTAHAGARTYFGIHYLRSEAMILADAIRGAHLEGFELASLEGGWRSPERVHAVLTSDGAFLDGEPLPDIYRSPTVPPSVLRAMGRHVGEGALRIAVGRGSDVRGLVHLTTAAFGRGAGAVTLVGRSPHDGSAVALSLARPALPTRDRQGYETIRLFLQLRHSGYVLAATDGTNIEIPRAGSGYDLPGLRDHLRDRRLQEPDRRDLILAPEHGVSGQDLLDAAAACHGEGFDGLQIIDAHHL